jgi:hypothetical protein
MERVMLNDATFTILKNVMQTKLTPRRAAVLLAFFAGAIVLVHVTTLVFMWGFGHDNLFGLTTLFDLDGEYNVPSFFSFAILMIPAALLVFIAAHHRAAGKPRTAYWIGLSLVFTYLAADEGFELHERLGRLAAPVLEAHELSSYAWLVPYAILCVLFLAVYSRFLRQLPPADRKRVLLSGVVYVAGAAGAEFVGALYVHHFHTEHALGYDIETAIEESLEMAGAILFTYALLKYIEVHMMAHQSSASVEGAEKKRPGAEAPGRDDSSWSQEKPTSA